MYPFKFIPIYKEIMWGGRDLEKMGRQLPAGKKIAESWELSVREKDDSVISNGELKGKTLSYVISANGREILGDALLAQYRNDFPLLVKIIDANEKLSVQVHPTDEYAVGTEGEKCGKDETWVILACDRDAEIVCGLKEGTDRKRFTEAVEAGDVKDCLNYLKVHPGDIFNIYPGLVHGIGKGIVTAEIQQNSNTTYRIYDYDRKDDKGAVRELHIKKALDVIDFGTHDPHGSLKGNAVADASGTVLKTYVNNRHYVLQTLDIKKSYAHDTNNERFYIYLVVSGNGIIEYDKGSEPLSMLQTVLIPACLGEYEIKGGLSLIRAYSC
jgi:mannose-6-phosphate isomerase